MATSRYVGIDVSKDRLDVAVLGAKQTWQVENTKEGILGFTPISRTFEDKSEVSQGFPRG